jgi:hypothetical protein
MAANLKLGLRLAKFSPVALKVISRGQYDARIYTNDRRKLHHYAVDNSKRTSNRKRKSNSQSIPISNLLPGSERPDRTKAMRGRQDLWKTA